MTHTRSDELSAWIHRLQSAASETEASPPQHSLIAKHAWVENFRDEHGVRDDICSPFLSWHAGLRGLQSPPDGPPDVMLWWSLQDASTDASRYLRPDDAGPVINQPEREALDAWTERELRGLHALWNLARERDRADWRARCFASVSWIIQNLQPENAPDHPWAIQVFILHSLEHNRAGTDLYAQALLHNCRVGLGRPDQLSALILQDAANALTAAAGH